MSRLLWTTALVLAAAPATAETLDCGGDAYSRAEVVRRPAGVRNRGPVTSVPQTLCADLGETRPSSIGRIDVQIGAPLPRPPGATVSRGPDELVGRGRP